MNESVGMGRTSGRRDTKAPRLSHIRMPLQEQAANPGGAEVAGQAARYGQKTLANVDAVDSNAA
jgi:hypothetical protein